MFKTRSLNRFIIVGSLTAIIYYSCLLLLVEILSWKVLHASSLAFVTSLILNYFGHYFWSFNTTNHHKTALFRYTVMNVGGFSINSCLMFFANNTDPLIYLSIQTLAIMMIVVWNYSLSSRWVYLKSR